ncbi:hypothetical protein [Catenulispora rubra]|uniref:hypothetical protein n=1 Tax=Catenulispora rubra TaxID=280293 RepID=UPI001892647B|nr:hypothetical protein [Catenulispora rubra]
MTEPRRYFGLDYPRIVLTLLRILVHQGPVSMAAMHRELGLDVHQDAPGSDVRHTLLSAVQLLAALAQDNAAATGRTLEEVVDELSIKLELANTGPLDRGSLGRRECADAVGASDAGSPGPADSPDCGEGSDRSDRSDRECDG